MSARTFRKKWIEKVEKDWESFLEVLSDDPFEDWEQNRGPETMAELELCSGLELMYTGKHPKEAKQFLLRCLQITSRAKKEGKLQSPLCKNRFPLNRGHLLRAEAYALALLGSPVGDGCYAQAATDIEQYCHETDLWDSQIEAYYLSAIRLAILGNNPGTACRLIQPIRKWKDHSKEALLLHDLLFFGDEIKGNPKSRMFRVFTDFFDCIRDPDYQPDFFAEDEILRLEIGAIREKVFLCKNGQIDWQRVVEAVGQ